MYCSQPYSQLVEARPTDVAQIDEIVATPEAREAPKTGVWNSLLGKLAIAGRRKLVILGLGSALASGGTSLMDAPLSYAKADQTPKPIYGLSGLDLTNPELNITAQPGWNLISGPNSAYHTKWIRAVVHPSDLTDSDNIIKAYLKYAQDYLEYKPGLRREAPIVVSLSTTNSDITTDNSGIDICDHYIPGTTKANKSYNLTTCLTKTERIEKTNTDILMHNFPEIIYWTPQNEPEDAAQPTNNSEGGAQEAVKLYIIADKIARIFKEHRVVIAGEFWNFPSAYERDYLHKIVIDTKRDEVPEPSDYAIHSYIDSICGRLTNTMEFARDLEHDGLEKPAEKGGGIWETEDGVPLKYVSSNCTNAITMANGEHKNTATLSAAKLSFMTSAQIKAAQTFMNIYKADPKMRFHIFYYDPDPGSPYCWQGGNWDGGLWAPDGRSSDWTFSTPNGTGIPGSARAAMYVLTGQKVPQDLLHPDTKEQIQTAKLTNIPPVNWATVKSANSTTCNYANTVPH